MSTLEYTIYGLKRGWRVTRTFLFAGAFAAAVVAGLFSELSTSGLKIPAMVAFGLWSLIFGAKVHRRFSTAGKTAVPTAAREELELGLLLVVALHAGIQVAGGLGSPLYPLVFVLVAFLVVYTRQWVGFTLVAATIGVEMALVSMAGTREDLIQSTFHAIFVVFFALINMVFTRSEIARMRRRAQDQIESAKNAVAEDARDFRLTSAASGRATPMDRSIEEARLSRCTVGEVRRAMYHHVDLLKRTMGLNTCLLLWLEGNGDTLRRLECVSASTNITGRKIERREGVVGAVIQSRAPVCLKGLRPGYPGIPYYDEAEKVTDFLGVPVVEGAP